jgi:oligo-1,6-glucosidase
VQWDDSPNAGFTSGTPWMPVQANYVEVNAAAARADQESVFHHYRKLIELRHNDRTVVHGDFTMLLHSDPQVYGFTRALDGDELLVLVNVSGEPAQVEVPPGWTGARLLLGTHPQPSVGNLRAWEATVFRRAG